MCRNSIPNNVGIGQMRKIFSAPIPLHKLLFWLMLEQKFAWLC